MTAPGTITAQHWAQQTPTGCRTVDLHAASLQTSQGTEPHLSIHIPGTADEGASFSHHHHNFTSSTMLCSPIWPIRVSPSNSTQESGELTQTHPGGAVQLESGRPPDGSECLCAVATWTLRTADSYTNTSFTWYWAEKNPAIYSKVTPHLCLGLVLGAHHVF